MTMNRLELCLATAITIGAAVATATATAQAQEPSPPAPPAPAPAVAPQAPAQYPAGQPYPGQPYPQQPYPGQPYPQQPYPGQPYPAQPYPGQPYPAQAYPGQPYPGQPQPNLNTTVHLESTDREATLYQNTGSSAVIGYAYRGTFVGQIDYWNRVCRAPCDQPVDTNGSYSIRGNGIVPSGLFSLPAGPVRVNVQAGHVGPRIGGLMLTALGGGTLLGGALLLGVASLFSSVDTTGGSSFNTKSYYVAGGVMIGVGAGALAGGIVLLIKSRTRVQINGETLSELRLGRGRPLYVSAQGLRF